MTRIITILLLILAVCTLQAQQIEGSWTGKLSIPQGELRVNFHITSADGVYTSTMDSPDQNAFGIPVDSTFYNAPELTIKVPSIDMVYTGKLTDDGEINGTLHQMGQSLELNLTRLEEE
jgi:hypothetical protein